jgi:4-hydroxy-tetrahydrodipicolinate reductase
VGELAEALRGWDAEIVETHHRGKREAPSGTALLLAEAIAAGREQRLDDHAIHGRSGESPRAADEIGIHALRAGTAPGEHVVLFAGEDEEIRLTHRALSRRAFARGAIEAAITLSGAPAGLKRT